MKPDPRRSPEVQAYLAQVRREMRNLERRANRLDPGLAEALRIKKLLDIKASRQYFAEQILWTTVNGAPVASSTTETILFPNFIIPANYMQDGRTLSWYAQGQHSTLGSGTVTLTFRLRWGGVAGTALCLTGAITQLISLTAAFWSLNITIQTKTNGTTGTIEANGEVRVYGATAPTIGSATGAPASAPMTAGGQITPAAVTVDLTQDTALSLTVQHGANSSSNTVTGRNYNGISEN